MVYKLHYMIDGLTEEEKYQVIKRIGLIKDHIYPELDIDYSCLHRENRVWIDQEISDKDKAFELFRLLSTVKVDKAYDDWYETGVDSHMECCLTCSYVADFPLD